MREWERHGSGSGRGWRARPQWQGLRLPKRPLSGGGEKRCMSCCRCRAWWFCFRILKNSKGGSEKETRIRLAHSHGSVKEAVFLWLWVSVDLLFILSFGGRKIRSWRWSRCVLRSFVRRTRGSEGKRVVFSSVSFGFWVLSSEIVLSCRSVLLVRVCNCWRMEIDILVSSACLFGWRRLAVIKGKGVPLPFFCVPLQSSSVPDLVRHLVKTEEARQFQLSRTFTWDYRSIPTCPGLPACNIFWVLGTVFEE